MIIQSSIIGVILADAVFEKQKPVNWAIKHCLFVFKKERKSMLVVLSGRNGSLDKLCSENHELRGFRSGRGQKLPPLSQFFCGRRWQRCPHRCTDKPTAVSRAVSAHIAKDPANISCDPKICLCKKGRWLRAFRDFSVSSSYYKQHVFPHWEGAEFHKFPEFLRLLMINFQGF